MRITNRAGAVLGALTLLILSATAAAPAGAATASAAATPVPGCDASAQTRALQQRLRHFHFAIGRVDGCDGPRTTSALLAFQKARGLAVDGDDGPLTRAALAGGGAAVRVRDRASRGVHVEIDISHQLLTLVRDGKPWRIYNATTGMPGHETPTGSFTIMRKYVRDWSVPYRTWMPFASYFTDDGVAIHAGVVGSAPASHGCVRVSDSFAADVFRATPVGTRVLVTS